MKFKIGDLVRPCYDPVRVETFDLRDDPSPIAVVVKISQPFSPHLNEDYYEVKFFDEKLLPALHTAEELELVS